MRWPARSSAVAWLFVATASVSSACGDYSVRLPNGFQLVRVHAGAVHIVRTHREGIVVFANVDGYAVLDDYVVGHVALAKHEFERSLSKPGYFVLDTSTAELVEELDLETWRQELRRRSIGEEPVLAPPSRFDRDYD